MCNQIFLQIYKLFLNGGEAKIACLEELLGGSNGVAATMDDERNEPEMYASLFEGDCRTTVELLYLTLLRAMDGRTYEQCNDLLRGLSFLQLVVTKAMWKYRHDVGPTVEEFAREFDRLDVASERMRLFEYAQSAV